MKKFTLAHLIKQNSSPTFTLEDPLTLVSQEDNAVVALYILDYTPGVQYKLFSNGTTITEGWSTYTSGTTFELNKGDYIQFLGSNTWNGNFYLPYGKIEAHGNILSLYSYDYIKHYSFFRGEAMGLFANCSGLVKIPSLKHITTLSIESCKNMFFNCNRLNKNNRITR